MHRTEVGVVIVAKHESQPEKTNTNQHFAEVFSRADEDASGGVDFAESRL